MSEADDGGHELRGRELLDPADEPGGRHDREVRQDREADDDPGDDPGGDEGAGGRRPRPKIWPPSTKREADEQPQGGTEETDDADHGR